MDDPALTQPAVRPLGAAGSPRTAGALAPLHHLTRGPLAAVNAQLRRLRHDPTATDGGPAANPEGNPAWHQPDQTPGMGQEALIQALEALPDQPSALGLDVANVHQCRALLDYCARVSAALVCHAEGRRWLYRHLRDRTGLLGRAPFNFQPALATVLDTLARRLHLPGGSDTDRCPPGRAGSHGPAERVLDLPALQAHPLYRSLPAETRSAIRALRLASGGPGPTAWEALAGHLLAAISDQADPCRGLAFSLLVLLAQGTREAGSALELHRDDDHGRRHGAWCHYPLLLQGAIQNHRRRLQGFGTVQDTPWQARTHARSRAVLNTYRQNLRRLLLATPQRFMVVRPGALPHDPAARARALLASLDAGEVRAGEPPGHDFVSTRPTVRHWLEEGPEAPPLLMAGVALANAWVSRALLLGDTEKRLAAPVLDSGFAAMALWLTQLCGRDEPTATDSPGWMVSGAAMAAIGALEKAAP